LPTNSEDKDKDNDSSPPLALVLPVRPILSTKIVVSTTTHKEHFTSARIKAIYMLEQKKSLAQIKNATEVPKTAVYRLYAVVRERG
jgi:hypothetical protein